MKSKQKQTKNLREEPDFASLLGETGPSLSQHQGGRGSLSSKTHRKQTSREGEEERKTKRKEGKDHLKHQEKAAGNSAAQPGGSDLSIFLPQAPEYTTWTLATTPASYLQNNVCY